MNFKFSISNFRVKAVLLVILTFLAYLFFTDFDLLKKVSYNIPLIEESQPPIAGSSLLSLLKLSKEFKIDIFAKDLEGPRVITFDSLGRMLISETKAGRVSILEDPSFAKASEGAVKSGEFKNKRVLIDGLRSPHGLAFYTDDKKTTYLYIAETHQVARYPYDVNTGKLTDPVGKNHTNLPAEGRHFTRTILFG